MQENLMVKEEWREHGNLVQIWYQFKAHCTSTEVRCSVLKEHFLWHYSSLLDFGCGPDGITGNGFTLIPVTNKNKKEAVYETMVFKTLNNRLWTTVICETQRKWCLAKAAPSSLPGESLGHGIKKGNAGGCQITWIEDMESRVRETKEARVCRIRSEDKRSAQKESSAGL